jgi:hypothetical protein
VVCVDKQISLNVFLFFELSHNEDKLLESKNSLQNVSLNLQNHKEEEKKLSIALTNAKKDKANLVKHLSKLEVCYFLLHFFLSINNPRI